MTWYKHAHGIELNITKIRTATLTGNLIRNSSIHPMNLIRPWQLWGWEKTQLSSLLGNMMETLPFSDVVLRRYPMHGPMRGTVADHCNFHRLIENPMVAERAVSTMAEGALDADVGAKNSQYGSDGWIQATQLRQAQIVADGMICLGAESVMIAKNGKKGAARVTQIFRKGAQRLQMGHTSIKDITPPTSVLETEHDILPMIRSGAKEREEGTSLTTLWLTGESTTGAQGTRLPRPLRQNELTGFKELQKVIIRPSEKLSEPGHPIYRPNCGLALRTINTWIWDTFSQWCIIMVTARSRQLPWVVPMMEFSCASWNRQNTYHIYKHGIHAINTIQSAYVSCTQKGKKSWRPIGKRLSVISHKTMSGNQSTNTIRHAEPNMVRIKGPPLVLLTPVCGSNTYQSGQNIQTQLMKFVGILIMVCVLISSVPVVMCAQDASSLDIPWILAAQNQTLEEDPDAIDLRNQIVANLAKNIVPVPKYQRGVLGFKPKNTSVDMATRVSPPPYRGYPNNRIDDTALARNLMDIKATSLNTNLLEYLF